MAKITILSLVFPPDSVSTAQLMGELASDLSQLGNEVTVLTTSPHYNRDLEAEAKQPLHHYWGRIFRKSNYHGIPVYHVIMPRKRASIVTRILAWVSFHILSTVAGMIVLSKPDVILAPSPPLTIGVGAWLLSLFHRGCYIYNVQEIYPDCAIGLGAIRNKLLIHLLYKLESFVYKKARAITVIAPQMGKQMLQKGVPSCKIRVIPNFVDMKDFPSLPKDNRFSRQHQVHNKFLVSYAGNMGPAQNLESFVYAAAILRNHSNIHFMMMGNGMLREELKKLVLELELTNLTFLPYQPYSLVPQIYSASDLCFVPQSPLITNTALPSKVYRIMACARPVLATTMDNSDLANLVNKAGCGLVTESGSATDLADIIVEAFDMPSTLQHMGQLGRKYVEENYSRKAISKQYHQLIESMVRKN